MAPTSLYVKFPVKVWRCTPSLIDT